MHGCGVHGLGFQFYLTIKKQMHLLLKQEDQFNLVVSHDSKGII